MANVFSSSTAMSAGIYTENICPKNWTLPTNSTFATIVSSHSSSYNIVYAGTYSQSKINEASGSVGRWWTRESEGYSSNYSTYLVKSLKASSGKIISTHNGCQLGFSVRCLAI